MTIIFFLIVIIIFVIAVFLYVIGDKQRKKQEQQNIILAERHQCLAYMDQARSNKEHLVDASHIKALIIHLGENAFYDLQKQIQFSQEKALGLINFCKKNSLSFIIDFNYVEDENCEEEELFNYIPITLKVSQHEMTFKKTYSLDIYLDHDQFYEIHLYDEWTEEEDDLEVAYQDFVQNLEQLFSLGWKNYYYPHEARYASQCADKILLEQQKAIFPNNQIPSFEHFQSCLINSEHQIIFNLYLEDVVIKFLYTYHGFSALMEISKMDHLCFYQNHYLYDAENEDIDISEKITSENFIKYKAKAALLREQAEKEATEKGYFIDRNYIDPT